jgi:predicted TIM-barrel fold metal-dependent hydrolase
MTDSSLGPGFVLADMDQHFYEAADSFTRHLDKRFQYAIRWAKTEDGRTRLLIGDRVFSMISNPTFDPVAKPGALADYFRGRNSAGADAKGLIGSLEPIRPEYRDRSLRLDVLGRQNVGTACLLPTLALGIEELLHDDPPALHAVLDAFNRWIEDEWGYNRDGRIVSPPVFSLVDPAAAERELERVIEAGTRLIVFRPAPVVTPTGPRSLGDPAHDRFWAMAAEAGLVVAFHAADSGYAKHARDWGERTTFQTYNESPFAETLSLHVERPISDTLTALICHGVFDRHPGLRVATVELGSAWAPELLRRLGNAYGKIPQTFGKDPVEAFHEHIWITPFQEDSVASLLDTLRPERVLFGSDWPHPEGVAEPIDFLEDLRGLDASVQRKIMGDNLRDLLAAT